MVDALLTQPLRSGCELLNAILTSFLVMLLSGTRDLLNPDARRLSARFQGKGDDGGKGVGGSVELDRFLYVEVEGLVRVYPLLPRWEGGVARGRILGFVRGCLE